MEKVYLMMNEIKISQHFPNIVRMAALSRYSQNVEQIFAISTALYCSSIDNWTRQEKFETIYQ